MEQLPHELCARIFSYLDSNELVKLYVCSLTIADHVHSYIKRKPRDVFVLSYIIPKLIEDDIEFVISNAPMYYNPILSYKNKKIRYSFGKYVKENITNYDRLCEKLSSFFEPTFNIYSNVYRIPPLGIGEKVIYF